MEAARALLLGLIQGITEFLPISSSGHLLLTKHLFAWKEFSLLFDVLLHCATLLVIIFYFRAQLADIARRLTGTAGARRLASTTRARHSLDNKADSAEGDSAAGLILPLVITTAVTAGVGFLAQRYIPLDNLRLTGCAYIVTALLITAVFVRTRLADRADRVARTKQTARPAHATGTGRANLTALAITAGRAIDWRIALAVGLLQGVAVLPGISRAAATIMIARLCGVERQRAFEYSFLAAIPAILGALLLQIVSGNLALDISWGALSLGAAAAAASGYLSLRVLRYVNLNARTIIFVPYVLFLGAVCFAL